MPLPSQPLPPLDPDIPFPTGPNTGNEDKKKTPQDGTTPIGDQLPTSGWILPRITPGGYA